jgi:hypothetical protein
MINRKHSVAARADAGYDVKEADVMCNQRDVPGLPQASG